MGIQLIRRAARQTTAAMLSLTTCMVLCGVASSAEPSQLPTPLTVPLQCRVGEGPWQPCRMEVLEMGSRWSLVVAGQRLQFRHDGRGVVTMQSQGGPWRLVNSRWEAQRDLCWDGICARGDIPLD